jgi:hypothetical protein
VDFLGLFGRGDLASTDGPDGLISNDDLAPVGDLSLQGSELASNNLEGLSRLALLQAFAAAPYGADAVLGSVLGLGSNNLVSLAEDGPSLGVAQDSPVNAAVLQVLDGDLAGEGAIGLIEDILGGDANFLLDVLADEEEVEGRRGNNDLWKFSKMG